MCVKIPQRNTERVTSPEPDFFRKLPRGLTRGNSCFSSRHVRHNLITKNRELISLMTK